MLILQHGIYGHVEWYVFIQEFICGVHILLSIDGLSTSAVSPSEVTTLTHEPWDDAMERRFFEPKTLLSSTQSTEVL